MWWNLTLKSSNIDSYAKTVVFFCIYFYAIIDAGDQRLHTKCAWLTKQKTYVLASDQL